MAATLSIAFASAPSISKVYSFTASYSFGPFAASPRVSCSGATNATKVSQVAQVSLTHSFGASAGGAVWSQNGLFVTMDAPVTTGMTLTLTGVKMGSYTETANLLAMTVTGLQAPPTTLEYESDGGDVGADTPCPPSHCVMPNPNVEGASGPSTCGFTDMTWGPYPFPKNGTMTSVTSATTTATLHMGTGSGPWQVLRLMVLPTVSHDDMWQTELTADSITLMAHPYGISREHSITLKKGPPLSASP